MSEPIRLMQITHDLAIGGLQQVVVNLCQTIDREMFHITVLCLRALGPLTEELEKIGIKVILLPQKEEGTDYFSFLKVAKILRCERIQVIHTHNTQPLVDGTIGAILSVGKRRIIHTDHARQFPDKYRYMFSEWCMSHFVYKMVGVSEQTTKNLRKYEKIPSRKLMSIANGIDGSRFAIKIDKASMPKTVNTLSELIEILRIHKEKEQDIFYPWFEKNLKEHEMDQLVKRLKNKYSFEIENIR